MIKGLRTVIAMMCALSLGSCAKNEEQLIHSETMVIKKDTGEETKEEVRDPLEQGVKRDVQTVYPQ